MRSVVYSMSLSLDGYIVGPDGSFDWSYPSEEVFAIALEETRRSAVQLMGRRLYETMLFWEDNVEDPDLDYASDEFTRVWRALPKVVFSTTLTEVRGNARLATGNLAEEVDRLREGPDGEDIGIGGATLAAQASDLDLIDEYRLTVYPVLVGGGTPFFSRAGLRRNLELVENRTIGGAVAYLRYRVRHAD